MSCKHYDKMCIKTSVQKFGVNNFFFMFSTKKSKKKTYAHHG